MYIYKIENCINDKVYVGKTDLTLSERWKEHIKESHKKRSKDRDLYKAMNKYGADKFVMSKIENCKASESEEREKYWIEKFNALEKGYNSTENGM